MKRKLTWQEEGADFAAYEQPVALGGPSDKRGRDFSANMEVPKIDSAQHQPNMARKHTKQQSVQGKVCAKVFSFPWPKTSLFCMPL